MPRFGGTAVALWVVCAISTWAQAPVDTELLDLQFDPFAEPPYVRLSFSATPRVASETTEEGEFAVLTLRCARAANLWTQGDHSKRFPTGYSLRELSVAETGESDDSAIVVRIVAARGWTPSVVSTRSSRDLYVRIDPATGADTVPATSSTTQGADSGPTGLGMFGAVMWLWLAAFGVIAFVGGLVAARFLYRWAWSRVQERAERRATITADDVRETRAEIERFQRDAAIALGGVASRQAELAQAALHGLQVMREEIKALTSEFDQATQSVLLFADPAQPASSVAKAPKASGPERKKEDARIAPIDAGESEPIPPTKSPYDEGRELLARQVDHREIAKRTGLSVGEVEFLAQTEGIRHRT